MIRAPAAVAKSTKNVAGRCKDRKPVQGIRLFLPETKVVLLIKFHGPRGLPLRNLFPLHRLVRVPIFLTMKDMKSTKGQRTKLFKPFMLFMVPFVRSLLCANHVLNGYYLHSRDMRQLKPFPVRNTVLSRQGGWCSFGTVPEFCARRPISR